MSSLSFHLVDKIKVGEFIPLLRLWLNADSTPFTDVARKKNEFLAYKNFEIMPFYVAVFWCEVCTAVVHIWRSSKKIHFDNNVSLSYNTILDLDLDTSCKKINDRYMIYSIVIAANRFQYTPKCDIQRLSIYQFSWLTPIMSMYSGAVKMTFVG